MKLIIYDALIMQNTDFFRPAFFCIRTESAILPYSGKYGLRKIHILAYFMQRKTWQNFCEVLRLWMSLLECLQGHSAQTNFIFVYFILFTEWIDI